MGNSDKVREQYICRTRKIVTDIFECLEKPPRPQSCGYSFIFGPRYFCNHPDRLIFADRSNDNQGNC